MDSRNEMGVAIILRHPLGGGDPRRQALQADRSIIIARFPLPDATGNVVNQTIFRKFYMTE